MFIASYIAISHRPWKPGKVSVNLWGEVQARAIELAKIRNVRDVEHYRHIYEGCKVSLGTASTESDEIIYNMMLGD